MLPVIGEWRPWTEPGVTSIGRLPTAPSSTVVSAPRASLDGRWSFRLFDHPDVATLEPRADDTAVRVPGNWTLQRVVDQHGQPDLPIYTNVQMPFDGPPPALPERNPTGVYRRDFTVKRGWAGDRIVLHVGGAESVHAVYVNGEFAGYGTDSRLPSEYDVTDLVTTGRNELAIVVIRWSAQSYVEDQDQWWMAGLHRSVFVEARPTTRLTSLRCDADLDPATGTGILDVVAGVGGHAPPSKGWTLRVHLETDGGRRVGRRQTATVPHAFRVPYLFEGHEARVRIEVPQVRPWSAEAPNRYRVVAELVDALGVIVETHHQLVGFRRVEIRDRQVLVNGEPVWIFGVNRHDHHPERGKAVTVDDMRADLEAMRRLNVNAVRTAHYPNDSAFYDLCDELGFYVIDEADIESHAYNTSLCHDPGYRETWLERVSRMVERDRNHPSIVMWSLGNESGYGAHHDAAASWVRRVDPSRPLHYEGAVFHAGWVDGGLSASDVVCPMYPTIDDIRAYGERGDGDRPLIMCEYSHAMGNSNGGLADYWDAITTTPGLQGGFLWEWKDHGITTTLSNGKRGFAHGGHFGESVHDGNFVADGVVAADLTPHPAAQEITWVHRPIVATLTGRGRSRELRLEHRRFFVDTSDLVAGWELLVGGDVVASGALELEPLGPAAAVTMSLPVEVPDAPDAYLTIRWRTRRATWFAPAGHLVAWDQLELRPPTSSANSTVSPTTAVAQAAEFAGVGATEPELQIFRAPIDNDGFKLMPELSRRIRVGGASLVSWQDAGIDRRPADEFVDHTHEVVDVDGGVEHHHTVVVDEVMAANDLARIGVRLELPARFDRLRWHGRGPLENYPDRNRGALLGVWEAEVDELPYLVPQEFGLRTDCRWFEFGDPIRGDAVRLCVIEPIGLHVSATRHTTEQLYDAPHQTDLRRHRRLVVHVDVAHRGLGTASCGPDALPSARVTSGTYRFAYRLTHHHPA